MIEALPAALPDLLPLTYAGAASTIPARLPPLPKVASAPAPETPEPESAPARRWRRKRYKPLYESASRSSGGAFKTFFIGLALFSATTKICFKLVPEIVNGISKATSSSNSGITSSGAQQSPSDKLLAEAEDIASRMEQLLAELHTVHDGNAVLAVRDRVVQMENDMQAFLSRARMARVTRDVAERLKKDQFPRIQKTALQIEMQVNRMALLVH